MIIRNKVMIRGNERHHDFAKWSEAIKDAVVGSQEGTEAFINFEVHHDDGRVEAISQTESNRIRQEREFAHHWMQIPADMRAWQKTVEQIKARFGKENWK